ncbi:MAG: hypothetical protein KAH00_03670 [Cocleimonas sp.]|nr:hypothetical protein [Cocleimonas sp.]
MLTLSIDELIERKRKIETLIRQFNLQWPEHCLSAIVWKTPVMEDQLAPESISLERLVAEQAIQATKQSLLRFNRKESQHPATVTRLPGIIRLTENAYEQVAEINAYKDELRQCLQPIHPRTRPKYVKLAWPGVSALQLYRHIAAPYSTKRKVLFSWIGHTMSSTRTTRDKMLEFVRLSRALVPTGVSIEHWNIVIDKEIDLLASLAPTAHLILQKRVAPHPRVMVYHQQEKQPTRTYGANLPLFIPDDPTMEVRELMNWDNEVSLRRKRRKDKLPSIPLIPRIYLYLREF